MSDNKKYLMPKGYESLSGSDKRQKDRRSFPQGILDQRGTKTSPGLREAPRLRNTIARDITGTGR